MTLLLISTNILKGREGGEGKRWPKSSTGPKSMAFMERLDLAPSIFSFQALRLTEYKYCMMPQSCPSKWLQDASFPLEQGKYCGMEAPGERLEKLLVTVCSKVLVETKTWRRNSPHEPKTLFLARPEQSTVAFSMMHH